MFEKQASILQKPSIKSEHLQKGWIGKEETAD